MLLLPAPNAFDRGRAANRSDLTRHALARPCFAPCNEIYDLCEISDLLIFVSFFASQSKGIKFFRLIF